MSNKCQTMQASVKTNWSNSCYVTYCNSKIKIPRLYIISLWVFKHKMYFAWCRLPKTFSFNHLLQTHKLSWLKLSQGFGFSVVHASLERSHWTQMLFAPLLWLMRKTVKYSGARCHTPAAARGRAAVCLGCYSSLLCQWHQVRCASHCKWSGTQMNHMHYIHHSWMSTKMKNTHTHTHTQSTHTHTSYTIHEWAPKWKTHTHAGTQTHTHTHTYTPVSYTHLTLPTIDDV